MLKLLWEASCQLKKKHFTEGLASLEVTRKMIVEFRSRIGGVVGKGRNKCTMHFKHRRRAQATSVEQYQASWNYLTHRGPHPSTSANPEPSSSLDTPTGTSPRGLPPDLTLRGVGAGTLAFTNFPLVYRQLIISNYN